MTDYGTDFTCSTDLDPALSMASGRTCLIQAIVRRLITPRFGLFYDPNYGTDVRAYVNVGLKGADLARFGMLIDREIQKDQRVVTSATTCVYSANVMTVTSLVTDGVGPFWLVLGVTSLSVAVLEQATS